MIIKCDNQNVIVLTINPKYHSKSRYIEIYNSIMYMKTNLL
jgi:hypothetical protein